MSVEAVILLAAYGTLIVEIGFFPVASEASVLQLLCRGDTGSAPELAAARAAALPLRIFRYLVPTAMCIAFFALPVAVVLMPACRPFLAPWSAQVVVWPGLAAVVLGRMITFASVLQLRRAKRQGALPGGLFGFSRNPGLVGMFLMYVGLCFVVGGPWLWLGAPVYFANMHVRVKYEESDLRARFGSSRREYERAVPRYLPLLGLR